MSSISEKIKKLLALGKDKGATEAEAMRAMELASALMVKHGIDESTLDPDKPRVADKGGSFSYDRDWQLEAAQAAAKLYGCTTTWIGTMSKGAFSFVGRSDNIDAAQETSAYLILQIEQLYKANLPRGMSQSERAKYRKEFKFACARRVRSRAHAIVKEQQSAGVSGSTALVVVDYHKQLEDEIERKLKADGVRRVRPRAKQLSGVGAIHGYTAGDQVDLNRAVE